MGLNRQCSELSIVLCSYAVSAPLVLLLGLAAATANADLKAGIAKYRAGDSQGALGLLFRSLDANTGRKDRGRARLYIGLIQHEQGSVKDAEASFRLALGLAPRLRAPKSAPPAARKLFNEVKKKLGLRPKVRKKPKRTTPPPPKAPPPPNVLQPADPSADGGLSSRSGEVSIERNNATVPLTNAPELERPESEIPTATWIAAGAGAAVMIAAVTLGVLSSSTNDSAFESGNKQDGDSGHSAAKTQHTLSVAGFVVSGALFGAAAVTLVF